MAEIIKQEGTHAEIKAEVAAAHVNEAFATVWKEVARQVRVPGFRAGKAPRSIVEARVGADHVPQGVRERLINKNLGQQLNELKLNALDVELDEERSGLPKEGESYTYYLSIDLYPEFELGDWESIKLEATAPEVTDEVFEKTLADLRERFASYSDAEEAATESDRVLVLEDGEKDTQAIYLEDAEDTLKAALLGKKVGDTAELTYEGEEAVKLTIKAVQQKSLPELDNDFAGKFNLDTMDALKERLRSDLDAKAKNEGESARRNEFIEKITEAVEVEVPAKLIASYRENMMRQITQSLGIEGASWSEYEAFMKEEGKLDEFMAELDTNAKTQAKRDLVLGKLGEALEIQVTNAELNSALFQVMQQAGINPADAGSRITPQIVNAISGDILRGKTIDAAIEKLSK